MRIAVIGTGYVGLVSGACFAEFGFHVTCIDKDSTKIAHLQKGIIPIYEPGLEKLVSNNVKAQRLHFSTDLTAGCREAQVVIIAVGTPSRVEDGCADMQYVHAAAIEIAQATPQGAVIVTKSTVPLGTGRYLQKIIGEYRPSHSFHIVSNPEFLREGSAIEDFMRPDRVVIGCETEHAHRVMYALYRPLMLNDTPIIYVDLETAELSKYAANSFLAMKIAFINEMADLAEKCGANIEDVARTIGMDTRIGPKFLHPGPGYGGSCFPKDTRALLRIAEEYKAPLSIIQAVHAANTQRKKNMVEKIKNACGGSVKGLCIGIWGVTFKSNTDDIRESASLEIIPALQQEGAIIQAFDPAGMEVARAILPHVRWCESALEAAQDAEAVVVLTEWNEFRALDLSCLKKVMRAPLVIDLRNIYDIRNIEMQGFHYVSLGRPRVGGTSFPLKEPSDKTL